jgi:hypothetical protein
VISGPKWERGSAEHAGYCPRGWERMSGFAIACESFGRQGVRRSSAWAKDYLRKAAVVDFGCAILGVFAAVQLRFGNAVTGFRAFPPREAE